MKSTVNKKHILSLVDLEDLEKSGMIPIEKRPATAEYFRKSIPWHDWITKSTGTLGLLFFLAGVVFFFASNWKGMSPFLRFGVLEGGVTLAALVAMWRGLEKISGQAALFIASMFTGVLLAVYGQVYQTGADAYEVYALWSGLILIWAVASRSLPLWTLWIVVVQTALALFNGQVLTPSGLPWDAGFVILGLFNLLILALWEWLHRKDLFLWTRRDWFRPLVLGAGLFWLSGSPIRWIFEFRGRQNWGSLVWVAAVLAVLLFYWRVGRSVVGVGIGLLVAASVVVLAIARMILDHHWETAGWFLTSLLSLAVFGGAATLLVRFSQSLKEGDSA